MHSDPIADLLTRIRNANSAKQNGLSVPYSKVKHHIVDILVKKDIIQSCEVENVSDHQKNLIITFKPGHKVLNLKRISKPGQRVYKQWKEIRNVRNGYGIGLYSTTQGIVTDREAKEAHCGGELLCEIY